MMCAPLWCFMGGVLCRCSVAFESRCHEAALRPLIDVPPQRCAGFGSALFSGRRQCGRHFLGMLSANIPRPFQGKESRGHSGREAQHFAVDAMTGPRMAF
uniref:Uncharacterized protein n=1 Tax=Cupriavidus pinatubonensis (strain JMP 134 / LMG 1197) TaxID=264198 RepID=Q46ZL1_CUPPJ